jgi:hypothetical protein
MIRAARLVLTLGALALITNGLTPYWSRLHPFWPRPAPASRGPAERDSVTTLDEMLAPLRPVLRDRKQVGFVSDRNHTGLLFRTQYALSPTLIVPLEPIQGLRPPSRSVSTELVVGVFEDPRAIEAAARRLKLTPVRAFGRRVILFRKRP